MRLLPQLLMEHSGRVSNINYQTNIVITPVFLHTSTCQCRTPVKVTVVANSQAASLQVVTAVVSMSLVLFSGCVPGPRICVHSKESSGT